MKNIIKLIFRAIAGAFFGMAPLLALIYIAYSKEALSIVPGIQTHATPNKHIASAAMACAMTMHHVH